MIYFFVNYFLNFHVDSIEFSISESYLLWMRDMHSGGLERKSYQPFQPI